MAKTREPTLADIFAATPVGKISPVDHKPPEVIREIRNIQRKIMRAEKFIFDREAGEHVGIVLRDIPELLVEQIQFARAPFDLCWIELSDNAVYDILVYGNRNTDDPTLRRDFGMLIDHNRISMVSKTNNGKMWISPLIYHMNTEWPLEDQLRFCDIMKISLFVLDQLLWGNVGKKLWDAGKKDYIELLRNTNRVEPILTVGWDTDRMLSGGRGDLVQVIAFLLLLNQPSLTQYVTMPSTRGWIKGKSKPFMKHNTVRMHLNPIPEIIKLSQGEGSGELRRRHRVRGHYCHNEAARKALLHHTCIHDWQPTNDKWEAINPSVGDEVEHWICLSSCGGRRWWREEHQRGDASKGYVDHTQYEVTR